MIRAQEPRAVLTAIIISVAALGCLGFVALVRFASSQMAANAQAPVDTTGWNTYRNEAYGFTLLYPPDWSMDPEWLVNDPPSVSFGNPLTGTSTYVLRVYVERNTGALASDDYVHLLITADRASSGAGGERESTPPVYSFGGAVPLTVNSYYSAYELSHVFEFDHNAEQIYVAHGSTILVFDFPSAEENSAIALPVANNHIAHDIVNTLDFLR